MSAINNMNMTLSEKLSSAARNPSGWDVPGLLDDAASVLDEVVREAECRPSGSQANGNGGCAVTTAKEIIREVASYTDLDMPACRHARLAMAYAKMAQYQILRKRPEAAMKMTLLASRCLARSLADAAQAARLEVAELETV